MCNRERYGKVKLQSIVIYLSEFWHLTAGTPIDGFDWCKLIVTHYIFEVEDDVVHRKRMPIGPF